MTPGSQEKFQVQLSWSFCTLSIITCTMPMILGYWDIRGVSGDPQGLGRRRRVGKSRGSGTGFREASTGLAVAEPLSLAPPSWLRCWHVSVWVGGWGAPMQGWGGGEGRVLGCGGRLAAVRVGSQDLTTALCPGISTAGPCHHACSRGTQTQTMRRRSTRWGMVIASFHVRTSGQVY